MNRNTGRLPIVLLLVGCAFTLGIGNSTACAATLASDPFAALRVTRLTTTAPLRHSI